MDVVETSTPLARYSTASDFYDEAFEPGGAPRAHYEGLLAGLRGADLERLRETAAADLRSRGVSFQGAFGSHEFTVDPIPRIVPELEWAPLAAGMAQRIRALNAFIADANGERRIVAAGVVPSRVIDTSEHREPLARGLPVPHGVYAGMAGLDLVRAPDGRFLVLEDNLRSPSGLAYVEATRDVLEERLPARALEPPPRRLGDMYGALAAALRAAAPEGCDDPAVALLSDGPASAAWFEHCAIARKLRIPIVSLDDLDVVGGRLRAWIDGRTVPIDVIYRRTAEDRLSDADGRPTALAGAVLEPLRRGTLTCVNAFGAGVADDKLAHAYVEDMVRFYLGEEPLIESVPTYDPADPDMRAEVLDRLDELVVKPRTGHGGHGVTIGPHARREDLELVDSAIRSDPESFVAQETIGLSRHPTVVDGELEPRHVDLRPFVVSAGDEVTALPGGLTRYAIRPGALVVNSSQDGGGKDTWVVA